LARRLLTANVVRRPRPVFVARRCRIGGRLVRKAAALFRSPRPVRILFYFHRRSGRGHRRGNRVTGEMHAYRGPVAPDSRCPALDPRSSTRHHAPGPYPGPPIPVPSIPEGRIPGSYGLFFCNLLTTRHWIVQPRPRWRHRCGGHEPGQLPTGRSLRAGPAGR